MRVKAKLFLNDRFNLTGACEVEMNLVLRHTTQSEVDNYFRGRTVSQETAIKNLRKIGLSWEQVAETIECAVLCGTLIEFIREAVKQSGVKNVFE